uniref:Coat protein n=1 Tax=Scaevola virus A TaxID=1046302 RepID=G9FIH2_9VIRU|nr:coat protein [Scaevola virus A]
MAAILNLRTKIDKELKEHLRGEKKVLNGKSDSEQYEIIKSIFSNIAIQGTSEETEFFDEDIDVTEYGDTKSFCKYNLKDVVSDIKSWKANHKEEKMRNLTFRQVCEAFAPEAKVGLMRLDASGIHTNLYQKMPDTCSAAPELAFDFNNGLNLSRLSKKEKKVVQNLNRRLFSSENAKAEVEAALDTVGDCLKL